jgi:hypothetical protein
VNLVEEFLLKYSTTSSAPYSPENTLARADASKKFALSGNSDMIGSNASRRGSVYAVLLA